MSTAAMPGRKFHFDGSSILGSLSRAMENIAVQRQAKADSFVRPYLAKLPEDELSLLGFSADEIEKIKACEDQQVRYQL